MVQDDSGWEAQEAPVLARLEELAALPAGAALVAGLDELKGVAVRPWVAVRLAAQWSRAQAWLEAQSMRAWNDTVLDGEPDAERYAAQELACASRVSLFSAMNRMDLVRRVAACLDTAWCALDAGSLTVAHVRALDAATGACPVPVARQVDQVVVPQAVAAGWTPAQLRDAAIAMVLAVDPEGAAERAAQAKAQDSDVRFFPAADEMASVHSHGDAAMMRAVMDAVEAKAAQLKTSGDDRGVGVRRVSALAELVLGPEHAARPLVEGQVTVPLTALIGADDQPGWLAGYGPITARLARQLLADAALRRLVTDPVTGALLDANGRRYRPGAWLARHVELRDRTCRFPGCRMPAERCDIDHIVNHDPDLANTTEANLHALCRFHHELKTRRLWTVDLHPDGTETWTSRLGQVIRSRPFRYPIEQMRPPPDEPCPHTDHDIDQILDAHPQPDPTAGFVADREWWLDEPPALTDLELEEHGDRIDEAWFDRELLDAYTRAANISYDAIRGAARLQPTP